MPEPTFAALAAMSPTVTSTWASAIWNGSVRIATIPLSPAGMRTPVALQHSPAVGAALETRALSKRYGAVAALDGVDLELAPGEILGLLGPNGAGKSTLVKIACGLVRASGGSAAIFGIPARDPAARAALGYLAELFRFPGWSTADEVLALHQRLAGSQGGPAERRRLLQ